MPDTPEQRRARSLRRIAEGRCANCASHDLADEEKGLKWPLCVRCRAGARKRSAKWVKQNRMDAFNAYGGPICACCGESEVMFLTIDHIEENGASHRREMGNQPIYGWLKANGYPSGYQVLCQNCNSGKWRNGGVCPHEA